MPGLLPPALYPLAVDEVPEPLLYEVVVSPTSVALPSAANGNF